MKRKINEVKKKKKKKSLKYVEKRNEKQKSVENMKANENRV